MKSGNEMQRIRFELNSNDIIPPINIRSFNVFERGISGFADRRASWDGAAKVKVKTLKAAAFSKTLDSRIMLKLKKLSAKYL